MTKENLAFLAGGFAFGALFAFGLFNAYSTEPDLHAQAQAGGAIPSPMGTPAPTQVGPSGSAGGAPMMAEINALKQRLQENGEDLQVLVRLANIYHDAALWEQAVGYYERAIAIRPDPDLLTDMGTCLRGLGQFDRAIESFTRASEMDGDHWQSRFNFAVVAGFDLGQFDAAMEAVKWLEARDPALPSVPDLRHALEEARNQAGSAAPQGPS